MLSSTICFKRLAVTGSLALVLVFGVMLALNHVRAAQARPLSTTFTVANTNNAGAGSLRQAILNANANPGADMIVFSLTGCPCVISLTTGLPNITDTLTIVGPGVDQLAVDGNDSVRVFDSDAVPVTLSDLTVQRGNTSGRGAGIRSAGALTLTNVSVLTNTAQSDGGGTYVSGTLTLSNTDFISNTAIGHGGGAYTGDAAVVNGAWFERNQSDGDGGGLYVFKTLTLTNTDFISNAAHFSGGGAFAYGIVQVNGGRFENNQSEAGAGGGLFTGSWLTLQDTDFISNSAALDGGGARAFLATQVIGGWFERNQSAADGGGLYVHDTGSMTSTQFLSNTAQGSGGGAYISGTLTLTNTRFTGNSAVGGGGGAYTDYPAVLNGGWFERNQSVIGGGLYVHAMVSMKDTQFLGNSADQGGGVYAVGPAQVDGGLFDHNQSAYGGGLEIDGELQVNDAVFISNTAQFEGGGAYVLGPVQVDGGLFEHNQANEAGGLYGGGTLILSGTQFVSNTAHDDSGAAYASLAVNLTGGLFQNNRCVGVPCFGGGLLVEGPLNITGTHFIGNVSQRDGGAVFVQGVTTVTNGLFQNNQCAGSACEGGGLNARDVLTVNNSVFMSNTAQSGGGGLYGVKTTLTGSIFQGNQCVGSFCSGGALLNVNELILSATQFISNTSQGDGGAVFADQPTTLTKVVFLGNTCTSSTCVGGGLYAEKTLRVNDTQFIHNTASQGGGLYHSNSGNARIVNTLFAGNIATSTLGAAMMLASPSRVEVIQTTIASPIAIGGSAIHVLIGTVSVTNTIIANHTIGISNTAGTVNQDYNLFFSNGSNTAGAVSGGVHSAAGDPKFLNAASDDYHLGPGSAAIDAGANAGVTTDFDGEARPQGSGFDIGFDESALHDIFLPLIMR